MLFDELYTEETDALQLIGANKMRFIFDQLQWLRTLPGDCAEVGVYKGGTSLFISRALRANQDAAMLYGFDTFAGMPSFNDTIDYHGIGCFGDTSYEQVHKLLKKKHCCTNVKLCIGEFPDSAEIPELMNQRFKFVHIDVDNYLPTKAAIEWFYPRMIEKGVMVFDDYEWMNCRGVKLAAYRFFADKQESVLISPNDKNQAYIVKQ